MKIAYLINEYPKVSHSFIRREILALERQGFDIQRIALRGWHGPVPDVDDQVERQRTRYVLQGGPWPLLGAAVRTLLRAPRRSLKTLLLALRIARASDRGLLYHLVYLVEACQILRWTAAHGARHLHAHFGTNSATVAMLTRALGGPPYSFTAHGPEEFERALGLGEKIKHASFAVTVSSFGRSQLYLRADYADWPKIHVVHCGLDDSFYQQTSSRPLPETRLLICVGRLAAAKGQPLLIEAAARLKARGIPCDLVLAGDGPLRSQLEMLIARHGLQDRVRITGWVSGQQVRLELLSARALVLPSFAEGLPVVIMEAMASRRPVIATYVAGIPELVEPGETGWLLPAGCVNSLADAMEKCLTLPSSELQKMGDAGYDRVRARHSIELEAAKLAELFRATDLVPQ